jgi:hypothetical protein
MFYRLPRAFVTAISLPIVVLGPRQTGMRCRRYDRQD